MSVEMGVALVVVLALSLPYLLPLSRVPPRSAAMVWSLVLALRALIAVAAAAFLLLYLPQTPVFGAVADWCLHAVLPLLATHLGFSGHEFGHLAVILPSLALAASVLWAVGGALRAGLAVRRRLGRAARRGPLGSVVVADPDVLVAVPVIGPGRPVVSERALSSFDESELTASLAHELGHVRRRHRPLLLAALGTGALARALPGSRAAERELRFHLERDADLYAVSLTRNPLALGSAICKAAAARTGAAFAALGGRGGVELRLRYLVDGDAGACTLASVWLVRVATAALAVLVVVLLVTLPGWAMAGPADVGVDSAMIAGRLCG
jgi:Zn-dependent protease with chaperone function